MSLVGAVMFSDIVGQMAIAGHDDMEMLRLIRQHSKLHKDCLPEHKGNQIGKVEDGIYSFFDDAASAVKCAIKMQRALPNNSKLSLRIGIHYGVIRRTHRGFSGPAMSGALSIESFSQAKGICISEMICERLHGINGISVHSIGSHEIKQSKLPLELYALSGEGLQSPHLRNQQSARSYLHQ